MDQTLALALNASTLLVVLAVVLLLFGAKRIPELMRSMGSGLREFKRGMDERPAPDEREPVEKE